MQTTPTACNVREHIQTLLVAQGLTAMCTSTGMQQQSTLPGRRPHLMLALPVPVGHVTRTTFWVAVRLCLGSASRSPITCKRMMRIPHVSAGIEVWHKTNFVRTVAEPAYA